MSDTKKGTCEVRVTGLPSNRKKEIENILSHTGTGVSELFRPKVIEVIESFPKHMRETRKPENP